MRGGVSQLYRYQVWGIWVGNFSLFFRGILGIKEENRM